MRIIGSGTRERDYSRRGLPNRWIGWVSYEDPRAKDGRRRQQSEFATEREAEAWVRFKVAENAVAPQAARAGGRETVGSLLEDYYRHGVEVADWSPRHRDNTRRILDGHLEPLHHLRVADLLVEDVDDLVAGLRARGISPHTLRQVRNALRAAFNFGIARRRIPQGHNPAALVEVTDTTRRPPKFVPPDRLGAFVEAVEGDWYGAFFLTTALLALRPSEAIG
ncbi:MAG: tyrosine recombinase XerC, partial [Sandaracinaceae bacterium]